MRAFPRQRHAEGIAPLAKAHRAQATRQQRRSASISTDESSENEHEQQKSRKEDDSLSLHATDDDVAQLFADPASNPSNVTDEADEAGEDEFLKELVASLQEEDEKGQKFNNSWPILPTKVGAISLVQKK